jgi:hypothetical protein
MKNNIEQLPVEIIDWIQSTNFEELDVTIQTTILKYIEKEEYENMRESFLLIQSNNNHINNHERIKSNLMNAFDDAYPTRKKTNEFSVLWKAASVLLFFSTLWFAYKQQSVEQTVASIKQNIIDTIYVEKVVQQEKIIIDTLWRNVKKESSKKLLAKTIPSVSNNKENGSKQVVELAKNEENDFDILTIDQANTLPNKTKRNSMKDDSLEMNYKFVSL